MLTSFELAARLGARTTNARPATALLALATPAQAGAQDLSFRLPGARREATQAAAIISAIADDDARTLLVDDVYIACARATAWLPVRRPALTPGVVHASATISATAVLGEGVVVGECSTIGPGVVLGAGVRVGAFTHVGANSVLEGGCTVGNRVAIGAGCALGEDGFAFVRDGRSWLRMPCFGSVIVGDDTTVLSQVVIHAGVFSDTVVGSGCALDSQVLIGHDSRIGHDTAIAAQTAIAGAARLGNGCRIGGKVGIGEGVTIADGVTVTAMSMVVRSLEQAHGSYSSGWPAESSTQWWRKVSRFGAVMTDLGRARAQRLRGS